MVILGDLESPVLTMSVINLSSLVGMGIGYRVSSVDIYSFVLFCFISLKCLVWRKKFIQRKLMKM